METRSAARKRANAAPIVINSKKQRVALAKIPNISQNQPTEKSQTKRNQKQKKPATTFSLFDNFNFNKPVQSINTVNLNNEQINQPYGSDISNYLRSMEIQEKRRLRVDYLVKVQRNITSNMSGILVDWLVEVAEEYKLLPETLHLSVSYVDRFLSCRAVQKSHLQLLGVSSMLIASKYEEIAPPKANDFCHITDNTYQLKEVITMEADILKLLNFHLGNPHVNTFLKECIGFATENQKMHSSKLELEFLCNYLAELSLLKYECIRFLPSILVASVIFLARFIICPEANPWKLLGKNTSNISSNLWQTYLHHQRYQSITLKKRETVDTILFDASCIPAKQSRG